MAYSKLRMGIGGGALAILAVAFGATLQAPQEDPLGSAEHQVNTSELPLQPDNGILARGVAAPDELGAGDKIGKGEAAGDTVVRHRRPMGLEGWDWQGYIGDGKAGTRHLVVDAVSTERPRTPPTCFRVRYEPGPTGWAGQYWLNTSGNWGQAEGADLRGYRQVVFWARGDKGGEKVEFKAGSIDTTRRNGMMYKDSFSTTLGTVALTANWQRYRIDLQGLDLSNVIGAFAWVAVSEQNPDGLVFYLDDIRYE